jgi:hypothetical protein
VRANAVTRLANRLWAETSDLIRLTKVRQSAGEKINSGPAGFLESRTATTPGSCCLDALAVRAAVSAPGPLDTRKVWLAHAIQPPSPPRDRGRHQRQGRLRAGGHCTEMLEDEFILADICLFFEKQLARHAVDVDDVGDCHLAKL